MRGSDCSLQFDDNHITLNSNQIHYCTFATFIIVRLEKIHEDFVHVKIVAEVEHFIRYAGKNVVRSRLWYGRDGTHITKWY